MTFRMQWGCACILGACWMLQGCIPLRSGPELSGTYVLLVGRQKIVLELHPDKSFLETIYLGGNHVERQAGHWNWIYDRVALYDLRIPQEFAPEYFSNSESHGAASGPSYSRPGYWSVRAESHWGTTILPIFPDDDINFVREKP